MPRIRSVCALCGSRKGIDPAYGEATVRLGAIIAERRVRLIYGGGAIGLMGLLADAVIGSGGSVVGAIPDFLVRREVGHAQLDDLIVTGSMHERKTRMFDMADGFVVLPGGLGTLDEAFEIITWKQLHLHDRPIVLLDVDGYWAPLRALVDAVVAGGFADRSALDLFTVVSTPEAVLPALEAAPEPETKALTGHL